MLGFEWFWALLLLPLPWFLRKALPAAETGEIAIAMPLIERGFDAVSPRQREPDAGGGDAASKPRSIRGIAIAISPVSVAGKVLRTTQGSGSSSNAQGHSNPSISHSPARSGVAVSPAANDHIARTAVAHRPLMRADRWRRRTHGRNRG